MRARIPSSFGAGAARQRGMALIIGLLLLLVLTIIGMSMFRGFGVEEQIAGNTREKQRAVNAATSAQQYAEWWLASGNAPLGGTCNGVVPSNPGQVCLGPAPTSAYFTSVPWSTGVTFTQFNQTLAGAPSGSQTSYYQPPVFYITDLGNSVAQGGEVFQIDAYGYGTNSNTVAVVESTYVLQQSNMNIGGE
jgi:type IV pilus assembly protein PilX